MAEAEGQSHSKRMKPRKQQISLHIILEAEH